MNLFNVDPDEAAKAERAERIASGTRELLPLLTALTEAQGRPVKDPAAQAKIDGLLRDIKRLTAELEVLAKEQGRDAS
jgi:hypothetical protein